MQANGSHRLTLAQTLILSASDHSCGYITCRRDMVIVTFKLSNWRTNRTKSRKYFFIEIISRPRIRLICTRSFAIIWYNNTYTCTTQENLILDQHLQNHALQITSLTIAYLIVYSPHKWPVTRKMCPFHDAIMIYCVQRRWGVELPTSKGPNCESFQHKYNMCY